MLDSMSLSNFKKLGDNLAILVIAGGQNLEDNNTDILKQLMGGKGKSCLYVTINQPYNRMVKLLQKKGIDTKKVYFIDCITKESGGKKVENDNVFYLNSPSNLTDLNISLNEGINSIDGEKILFFDALSTLIIYNKPGPFAKFTHSVMTKVKSLGITSIFVVVKGEIDKDTLTQIEQFSDSVINLT
jgi:KaiC/GvpD/RAD55 family RecA-like ATPase